MLELLLLFLVFLTILLVLFYIATEANQPTVPVEDELRHHIRALDTELNNLKIKYRECTKNKYPSHA